MATRRGGKRKGGAERGRKATNGPGSLAALDRLGDGEVQIRAETAEAERILEQFPFDREVVPPLLSGRRGDGRTAVSPLTAPAVVAVTGSAGFWGHRLVQDLERDERVARLVGIDHREPPGRFLKTRFFDIDVQDVGIVDVLAEEKVDVVVHLDTVEAFYSSEEVFERNVLGTMHLMAACARAGVRRIVIRSHGKVYGARPDNPNFLTEEMPLRASSTSPYIRDRIEIEKYSRKFQRLNPGVDLVILRTANVIGPTCRTTLTEYLMGRFVPTVVGFDPMGQLIHEDDVARAFHLAIWAPVRGPINVAADPPLPLSKVIRLAGKVPVPVLSPLTYPFVGLARRYSLANFTAHARDYIKYAWVLDTRRMRQELGLEPKHSALDALREFAERERTRLYT